MIRVSVEVREGPTRAPSIERALKMAGNGVPGRRIRLVFLTDPEVFFVPTPSGTREAA